MSPSEVLSKTKGFALLSIASLAEPASDDAICGKQKYERQKKYEKTLITLYSFINIRQSALILGLT